MGIVYTPDEFLMDRIPTSSEMKVAMEKLRTGLSRLYEGRIIYGANIHGSTVCGNGGPGSDIDVIVLIEPEMDMRRAEEELRGLHARIREENFVPVEFAPIRKDYAERGYHHLDRFFLNYVGMYCTDGIVGNAPMRAFNPSKFIQDDRVNKILAAELRLSKMSKDRTGLTGKFDAEHCDALEKYMRQTIHAASNTIEMYLWQTPAKEGRPMTKDEICETYKATVPVDAKGLFSALRMTKKYRNFLLEKEEKNAHGYVELLKEIDGIYPDVMEFLGENTKHLLEHC